MSDIAILFERDPEGLTQEELGKIIERYRQARAQFNLGVKSAGSTKKVKAAAPDAGEQIDLSDLGL